MPLDIKRIRASVIDGRARSPRFRQRQLVKLHAALESARVEIVSAICKDTEYTNAEAEIQYCLTLKAVQDFYNSLDFETLLEAEYSLAKSKDNSARRVPFGCAAILPSTCSSLYSTVVPLAAAIAAGNCCVVQIQQTLSQLNSVLRRVLTTALDLDTFAIADDTIDKDFQDTCCVTLGGVSGQQSDSSAITIKTPSSRVAAVVDKTANLAEAAKDLVRARFAFGGESPYAPDLVLVNEFCMKEFAQAIAQQTTLFIAGNLDAKTTKSGTKKKSDLQNKLADTDVTTIASGSRGTVALVNSRDSQLLKTKITEPVLLLHTMSSMDDAIDFLNKTNKPQEPLLASYFFGAPPAAKYLSQFVNASLSYTNRIPVELLIGPAAPIGFTPSIQPRYSIEMFSRPAPEYISTSPASELLSAIVDGEVEVKTLRKQIDVSLKPLNEPQHRGVAFGFFEQGILMGGSIALSTIVATVVTTAVVGTKYVYPVVADRLRG